MTDTPEDPSAESGEHVTPEEEVWQGNEPPVDDFADPAADASTEGEAGAAAVTEEISEPDAAAESGEAGDGTEEGAEDIGATDAELAEDAGDEIAPIEAPRRRSILLPIVVAVGGIAVLGGVLYWQFGSTSRTALPVNPPMNLAAAPVFKPTPAPEPVAAPQPAPVPSSAREMPPIAASALLPSAAPPSGTAAPLSSPPPSVATSSAPTRLELLSARVEAMQKALDQASQQMAELSEKLSSLQTQPAPANPEVSARLNQIEQKLNQIGEAPSPAAPQPAPKAAPKPAAPKAAAPAHHKAPPAEDLAADETGDIWVLRAAVPGEAWVAKDPSSPELRAVHVGDTLPGVGRVLAIQETTAGWIVQGSGRA